MSIYANIAAYLWLGLAVAGLAEMFASADSCVGEGLSPWKFIVAFLLWPLVAMFGVVTSLQYLALIVTYYPIKIIRHMRKRHVQEPPQ